MNRSIVINKTVELKNWWEPFQCFLSSMAIPIIKIIRSFNRPNFMIGLAINAIVLCIIEVEKFNTGVKICQSRNDCHTWVIFQKPYAIAISRAMWDIRKLRYCYSTRISMYNVCMACTMGSIYQHNQQMILAEIMTMIGRFWYVSLWMAFIQSSVNGFTKP